MGSTPVADSSTYFTLMHSDSLCNQVDVVDYTGSLASAADCAAAILADPSICPSGAFVMPENPAYFCRCCSSSAPQNDSPDWHIYQVKDISSETTSAPTFLSPPMDEDTSSFTLMHSDSHQRVPISFYLPFWCICHARESGLLLP